MFWSPDSIVSFRLRNSPILAFVASPSVPGLPPSLGARSCAPRAASPRKAHSNCLPAPLRSPKSTAFSSRRIEGPELLLFVGQYAQHSNCNRFAVPLNFSFVDRELDDGRSRKCAAAVFLILNLVTIPFRVEHAIAHESAVAFRRR